MVVGAVLLEVVLVVVVVVAVGGGSLPLGGPGLGSVGPPFESELLSSSSGGLLPFASFSFFSFLILGLNSVITTVKSFTVTL